MDSVSVCESLVVVGAGFARARSLVRSGTQVAWQDSSRRRKPKSRTTNPQQEAGRLQSRSGARGGTQQTHSALEQNPRAKASRNKSTPKVKEDIIRLLLLNFFETATNVCYVHSQSTTTVCVGSVFWRPTTTDRKFVILTLFSAAEIRNPFRMNGIFFAIMTHDKNCWRTTMYWNSKCQVRQWKRKSSIVIPDFPWKKVAKFSLFLSSAKNWLKYFIF